MDCSFKTSIPEVSSTNVDPKSVEKVELQIMDLNLSKMTPDSNDIDNGINRDYQVGSIKEETIANKDVELNMSDSTSSEESKEEALIISKGNFLLILHNKLQSNSDIFKNIQTSSCTRKPGLS